MDIPFKLAFFELNKPAVEFAKFSKSREEAVENVEKYSFVCKELHDLRILFEVYNSSADSNIWIDIFDMLPPVEFDDLEFEKQCFFPSPRIRNIYLNSNSGFNAQNKEYSAIIPGVYQIIVTLPENDKYYAFLEVQALRIKEEQLDLMKYEVESILSGLSKEVATKYSLLGNYESKNDSSILKHYNILMKEKGNLISQLNLILKEPRSKIQKKYLTKKTGQSTREDLRTTRLNNIRNVSNHSRHSFCYDINYDVSYNRNLKYMIKYIDQLLGNVLSYLGRREELLLIDYETQLKYKSSTEEINRKIEALSNHIDELNRLQSKLFYILNIDWLKELLPDIKSQDKLSRISYYREVYQVFNQLRNLNGYNLNPLQHYIHTWKETSKLYEIWGFLKILEILKSNDELNFINLGGWIFDSPTEEIYPFLEPETQIILSNSSGLEIIVRYDALTLDYGRGGDRDTELRNPLFTIEKNNRPDLRIDIYHNQYFKGSIIADFKYRSLDSLGRPNLLAIERNWSDGAKVYRQLYNYSKYKSYHLNRKENKKRNSEFAVKRVFGIYPKTSDEGASFINDGATNIIRCSLSPGVGTQKIEDELVSIICDCIEG